MDPTEHYSVEIAVYDWLQLSKSVYHMVVLLCRSNMVVAAPGRLFLANLSQLTYGPPGEQAEAEFSSQPQVACI